MPYGNARVILQLCILMVQVRTFHVTIPGTFVEVSNYTNAVL